MHYLRLILFNFNNTEYSSADDNSRSKGNNSNKDKSAVSLTLLAYNSHCFRKTSDRKFYEKFFLSRWISLLQTSYRLPKNSHVKAKRPSHRYRRP